jgi:hypothetical protein
VERQFAAFQAKVMPQAYERRINEFNKRGADVRARVLQ